MKKRFWMVVTWCSLILTLMACGAGGKDLSEQAGSSDSESNTETAAPPFISIGTAASGSSLYAYGTGLANFLSQELDYSQFDAEESGGTIANLKVMEEGRMEMSVGAGDAYYNGRRGQNGFDQPVNAMLGWKIAPSTIQFVTLESTGIEKIEDLKGKRISIGASGSAANNTALSILELHGISEGDVTISYLGWGEAATALSDGVIDVALILGTLPAPVIAEVAVREPIRLVNVDPEKMAANSVFDTKEVESGTYNNQAHPAMVPMVDQYTYFSPNLPEEIVYDITKLGMENVDILAESHPVGGIAEPIDGELVEFLEGELHPGVIKYYEEVGFL